MLVTIAILLLVYYGMRKETYERTTAYAQMAEKDDELIGKWCGCIMMVCAAAYQLYLEYLESCRLYYQKRSIPGKKSMLFLLSIINVGAVSIFTRSRIPIIYGI